MPAFFFINRQIKRDSFFATLREKINPIFPSSLRALIKLRLIFPIIKSTINHPSKQVVSIQNQSYVVSLVSSIKFKGSPLSVFTRLKTPLKFLLRKQRKVVKINENGASSILEKLGRPPKKATPCTKFCQDLKKTEI